MARGLVDTAEVRQRAGSAGTELLPARAGRRRAAPGAAALAAAAFAAGAWLRVVLARDAALWGDELHSLRLWRDGLAEIASSYDRYGSGLALPLLQHLAADALGETIWAVRLPALLGGLAALALVYPVGRRVAGPWPAALAALGLALSPLHLFYSHFGRAYALVVALALVLLDGVARLQARPTSRLAALEVGAAAALLPWVHLTAAALVGAGALGAALAAPRAARRPLAAALVLGALACVLAYLPARESFLAFVGTKAGAGSDVAFGALDVAAIAAGGRLAGAVWLVAVPAAAAAWLRARGASGAPLVAVALVPLALVAAVDPRSDAIAFTRYAIGCLPALLLLLAWGALAAGERLGGRRGAAAGGLALVALLAGGAWPPLASAAARRDGPFANTYLGLHPAPAFDVAPPADAELHRALRARDDVVEIVEVPAPRFAGALLYRALARAHGKPVRLGAWAEPPAGVRAPAVASLSDLGGDCDGVRVVTAHRDLAAETSAFLAAVAGRLPAEARIAEPLAGMLAFDARLSRAELAALARSFGEPFYASARVVAFEVPCRAR